MTDTYNKIIIFDGLCNLCNASVQFIIKNDPKRKFVFTPAQSMYGKNLINSLGLSETAVKTLVFVNSGKPYTKSTAVLKIIKELNSVLKLLYGLIIIPTGIRDVIYLLIAKNRYRWFGKRTHCKVPSEEDKKRIIL